MVGDSIVLLTVFVGTVFAFYAIGALFGDELMRLAVEMLLTVPKIGDVSCQPPPVGSSTPVLDYGIPGRNTPGCLHMALDLVAIAIMGAGIFVAMVGFLWRNMLDSEAFVKQWGSFVVTSIFLIIFLPFYHIFYDFGAGVITNAAIAITAHPHGGVWGVSPEEARARSSETITYPYKALRDVGAMHHECVKNEDTDLDGFVDDSTVDGKCLFLHVIGPDFLRTMMVFSMGSMISVLATLTVFTLAIMRFQFTEMLAVAFPFLLAMSRLPFIGKIFQDWLQAFAGLLMAPLMIALILTVGLSTINGSLTDLRDRGADDAAIKDVKFFMLVALAMSPVGVIIMSAKFMGFMGMMVQGLIGQGLNAGLQTGTKMAGMGGGAAVTHLTGNEGLGKAVAAGVGAGGMMSTGAGYSYSGGYNLSRPHDDSGDGDDGGGQDNDSDGDGQV